MKSTYVHLTGGLGNQLFQLAAALYVRESIGGKVFLDLSLGKPRSTNGDPDVLQLNLPASVASSNRSSSYFEQKVAGFMLRMGILPSKIELLPISRRIILKISEIVFSLRYRKPICVFVSNDVGFSEVRVKDHNFLIGYFQTYKYLECPEVREKLSATFPLVINERMKELIDKALVEGPIFLHVRLKDYLKEKDFGIPHLDYYRNSLTRLQGSSRKIWVFSDDLESAKRLLPMEFQTNYFFVEDQGLSPAQILHVMRYGKDYVIANSTFSWWAASLCIDQKSRVIAPEPWFASMPEPKDLIPPHWIREKAFL
jgi:hypothetical protein